MGEFENKWQETEINLQQGARQQGCIISDLQELLLHYNRPCPIQPLPHSWALYSMILHVCHVDPDMY
jgi:hypothetical protein